MDSVNARMAVHGCMYRGGPDQRLTWSSSKPFGIQIPAYTNGAKTITLMLNALYVATKRKVSERLGGVELSQVQP